MSHYSQYRGTSAGRLCHYLHEIVNPTYGGDIRTDEIQVDPAVGSAITYHRKHLATVERWDGDVPFLSFNNIIESWKPMKFRLERSQFIRRPFIDNPRILCNIEWVVQELRSRLTFDEALFITWTRDTWNCDWSINQSTSDKIAKKIKNLLIESYGRLRPEQDLDWQHIALCAVYGVVNEYDVLRRRENNRLGEIG